ncbi:MAG: NADH-quinone oxidoreductase subunit A [Rickettsiales bacterium]|nr:NADH-quinone oxidoreductase subunit A [Rickettsiales bacterium]|tara:strand:+ start:1226 stop:1588 length:363 start_codon:yes stop_codon:yes gene_type:complete
MTILEEYIPILIFLILALVISFGAIFASFVVGEKDDYQEKLSTYECGFEPFSDTRGKFDVKFYLVAILFIIFDLEIMFLFPWAVALGEIGFFGFWSMMLFLTILTIGFIYEWIKGALDWT